MNKYEKYKDSNVEWIGEIPIGWVVKPLKRLAKICNGQDHKNVWDENGQYPIIGTGGVFGKASTYLHTGPSVILGRKGTIDKPQFLESPFWSVDTAYYTEISEDVDPKLFFYLCTTINFDLYKYGSAVPSMTQEVLSQIPFAISPSLIEQKNISKYLDKKCEEFDQLIQDKKLLLTLYEDEKIALISQAVTQGLDLSQQKKNSHVEWLGEVPIKWEIKKLKYVASINDEALPETTNEEMEIEYVEISNVKSGIGIIETTLYKFKDAPSRARRVVKDGDIIVSTVRTYLKSIAKISNPPPNMIASTGFAVIRPKNINSEFLGYLFYSEGMIGEIISQSTGVSYPAISSSQIANIHIPIPSEREQLDIVNFVKKEIRRIDNQSSRIKRLIDLLIEYRTAYINDVVTGKIKAI